MLVKKSKCSWKQSELFSCMRTAGTADSATFVVITV